MKMIIFLFIVLGFLLYSIVSSVIGVVLNLKVKCRGSLLYESLF